MQLINVVASVPLPLPVFLIIVTFIYGLLKHFIPALPLTIEQVQFLLTGLLALLGIVVSASLRVQGVI